MTKSYNLTQEAIEAIETAKKIYAKKEKIKLSSSQIVEKAIFKLIGEMMREEY